LTYLSLAKAQKGLLDAVIEEASAFWKASALYTLNAQAAQEHFRKRRLQIEEDMIIHGGMEALIAGGGTTEQLTQAVSPQLQPLIPPVTMPTPPPPEIAKPAQLAMTGLTAIPKSVVPMPENVRILFEKPVESLAASLAASPTAVMEYSRQNLVDAAARMADSSLEMVKMASEIATARSLNMPITVEGLTVTPEKATDMLRNAYQAGYNILSNLEESIATLTEQVPLTANEESKIIDAITQITANLTAIRQQAQQPPRTIPPLKVKTIYGYEYICPICGAVYYTQSEIEAHMEATGHGTAAA
jgi:hypothetical protein